MSCCESGCSVLNRGHLRDFAPEVYGKCEENESIVVWRLPGHLSQSRLGDRSVGSNACTIIALKMAEAIHSEQLYFTSPSSSSQRKSVRRTSRALSGKSPVGNIKSHFPRKKRHVISGRSEDEEQVAAGGEDLSEEEQEFFLGSGSSDSSDEENQSKSYRKAFSGGKRYGIKAELVNALANSIVDGNQIHEWAVKVNQRGVHELNFTIPDAIEACDHIFREMDYRTVKGPMLVALQENVSAAVRYWLENECPNDYGQTHLFLLLIAHERTVLIVCQPQDHTIGLVDSHSHGKNQGALFASSSVDRLPEFCEWIINHIFPETLQRKPDEQEFEISIIRYSKEFRIKQAPPTPMEKVGKTHCSPYATRSKVARNSNNTCNRCCGSSKKKLAGNNEYKRIQEFLVAEKLGSPEKKGAIFCTPEDNGQQQQQRGVKRGRSENSECRDPRSLGSPASKSLKIVPCQPKPECCEGRSRSQKYLQRHQSAPEPCGDRWFRK